jgi:hypothetical protein
MLKPIDRQRLRTEFLAAKPFPHVKIDNFLTPGAATEIAASYPSFDSALELGRTFTTVNQRKKVQLTNSALFPRPVAQLNELLASPQFLDDLSLITGIPNILADENLVGGGIHMTGPGGRLDVHVDFNFMEEKQLHRRLNLLLYLNSPWEENWGGQFQLWDKDVKRCEATFAPIFNRCVIFETSEISYHGVVPVSSAAPTPRKSFAAYYYTREAPSDWNGLNHGTVFKARPEEKVRGTLLMPAEAAKTQINAGIRRLKDGIKGMINR